MTNDPEVARVTLAEMFHASPFGSGDADPLLDDYRDVELERQDGPKAWVLATLTFAPEADDPREVLVQFTLERMADGWYITLFHFDCNGQPE